jgi:hypothetical protein
MAAVTFDTLKFVKTLKEAGVSELQAEAFSTAVRESHEAADVATKGDITDLRHEMKELESRIDTRFEKVHSDMSDLKFELLKWIIGIAIAQAGFLIGLLKFLP